jgi:hypothetical protein
MSYPNLPNLSEAIIAHSTTFFNQVDALDGLNDELVSLQQIHDVCYAYAAQHPSYKPAESPFVPSILMTENKSAEDSFTQAEYEALQSSHPELTDSFALIDTNSTGSILGSALITYYQPQPQIIPVTATSHFWLEHIKEYENLTDASTITLEQFLTLQDTYNLTRYFPVTP